MTLLPQGGALHVGVQGRYAAGPVPGNHPRHESRAARADRTGTRRRRTAGLAVLLALWSSAVPAAETVSLTIKDHRFSPDRVSVPAGERFRIEVSNRDDSPEEFESADLKVEKIVAPGGKIAVMAGPLKPGTYKFFGDYHPDTAVGFITAVEKGK